MKVRISWAQIVHALTETGSQPVDWTAHCGCSHKSDGSFVRCAGHAAGQDTVECETQ